MNSDHHKTKLLRTRSGTFARRFYSDKASMIRLLQLTWHPSTKNKLYSHKLPATCIEKKLKKIFIRKIGTWLKIGQSKG